MKALTASVLLALLAGGCNRSGPSVEPPAPQVTNEIAAVEQDIAWLDPQGSQAYPILR